MPNRITPDLDALVGKSIARLCPQGFHDFDANHCAHFVSHVGRYRFGFLCHSMPDAEISTPPGVCVRVQELFPRCPRVGKWNDLPETDDDLLVFITARGNVNLTAKTIQNVPKKHIGILRDGKVYHYSNTDEKVVRQTPEAVRTRFRGAYRDSTVDLFFGTLPAAGRSARSLARSHGPSPGARGVMPQALSLHIGLNEFDPAHYGEPGTLAGCENDARDMAALARKEGIKPIVSPLLTAKATAANVVNAIKKAAAELEDGDTLFVTYAGHGAQVPDTNGDEPDRMDETWCLYDRMLIDDELAALWASFRAGVRIVMLSDSCHSGSVSRAKRSGAVERLAAGKRHRLIPPPRALRIYRNNKGIYDAIQLGTKTRSQAKIQASVLLISGCQDNQLSGDGDVNGLFTETLKSVWNDGAFMGTYRQLRDSVAALMPRYQQPRYSLEGAANATLEQERPFSSVAGAMPGVIKGGKVATVEKPSSPLSLILSLLKKFGMSKPNAKSDLRAWAKELEKQDAKLGLPASRAEAFVAECFANFKQLPLEKADITSGRVRTPQDIVDLLPDTKRRSRGGNDGVASFSEVMNLLTVGLTKEQFLTRNKTALDKIISAVSDKLRAKYGASASAISRHDLCVVFYCEAGLKAGKVNPDFRHSEGERGMLPLPSNIKSWNGKNAPAWDQPMSAVVNLEHFFLYMGHLKNKDLTGAPRRLYGGLFDLTGISGNPTIGAKVLAGVVHGYFYSGNYSDRSVPFDHLVESYQGDERLSEFMKNTNYRHAGTPVLTGRERNIDTALGLV